MSRTSAELTAAIEAIKQEQAETEAAIVANREAYKAHIAQRERLAAQMSETKKERTTAIAAEEKASRIAWLKAQLAELEGEPKAEPFLVVAA